MRTKIVLFLSTENYKREHLPLSNTYTGWQVSIHRNHLTFQVNSIGTGSLQYPQKWNSEHIFKNLCPVKSQYYSLIMFWNYKIVSWLFCDFSQWFLDTSNISTFAAKFHTLPRCFTHRRSPWLYTTICNIIWKSNHIQFLLSQRRSHTADLLYWYKAATHSLLLEILHAFNRKCTWNVLHNIVITQFITRVLAFDTLCERLQGLYLPLPSSNNSKCKATGWHFQVEGQCFIFHLVP